MKTGQFRALRRVVTVIVTLGAFSASPSFAHDFWITAVTFDVVPGATLEVRGETDSAAVARVVESYHAAEKAGDSTAMLALLADDAVILESGGIESRAEFRAHHIAADIAFIRSVKFEPSAVRVRTRGDAAWATSTSTTQGESNGRKINSVGAELMVLVREPNGWKITAIHWSSRQRRTP